MKKAWKPVVSVVAAASIVAVGSLTGCSLRNPFQASRPAAVQDSAPAVVSEAVVTSVPETPLPTPLPTVTPTPTPVPTIAAQVITGTPTPTPDPDKDLKVLGTESDAETTFKVRLENGTGQNIIRLAVRVRSDGRDTAEYMSEEEPFQEDEKVVLYYDASEAIAEAKRDGDIPEYQIRFTTADGEYYVIHDFPFGEIEEAKLVLGSGFAYITYVKMPENEEVSTEEAERQRYGVDDGGTQNQDDEEEEEDNSEEYEENNDGGTQNHDDEEEENRDDGGGGYEEEENWDDGGGGYEEDDEDDENRYGENNVIDPDDDEGVGYDYSGYDEEGNIVG